MNGLQGLMKLLGGHSQAAAHLIAPNQQIDAWDPNAASSMMAPGRQLQVQKPQGINSRALQEQYAPVVRNARNNAYGLRQAPLPQGNGQFNPGATPLQGSYGHGAYPQIGAYGGVQRPGDQLNPQLQQQSWNNY